MDGRLLFETGNVAAPSAVTKFGQFCLTAFGQFVFLVGARRGGGPEGWRHRRVEAPKGEAWRPYATQANAMPLRLMLLGPIIFPVNPPPPDNPPPDRPKFRSFFSLLAPQFSFFFLSLGVLSRNFVGVFESRNPEMCTFRLSGCRVKPWRPHQTGPPRLAHDSPRTPNVHFSGPRRFKHHQNSTEGPPREGKKKENCGGRKEKKATEIATSA